MIKDFDFTEIGPDLARPLRNRLSWLILECKCLYYIHDESPVPDELYDQCEKLYDALCTYLGEPKSASDMVGFDLERPSCYQISEKMRLSEHRAFVLPKAEDFQEVAKSLAKLS